MFPEDISSTISLLNSSLSKDGIKNKQLIQLIKLWTKDVVFVEFHNQITTIIKLDT